MFSKKRSFEIVLKTCFRVGIGTKPCRTHTISLRPVYLLDTSLFSQVNNTSSSKVNGEETKTGTGCTELITHEHEIQIQFFVLIYITRRPPRRLDSVLSGLPKVYIVLASFYIIPLETWTRS